MLDLSQKKLNKEEWDSIEQGFSPNEQRIIDLLIVGNEDIQREIRILPSFSDCLHIEGFQNETFGRYLEKPWQSIALLLEEASGQKVRVPKITAKVPKKADVIRFNNLQLKQSEDTILEPVILALLKASLRLRRKRNSEWLAYYYAFRNVKKHCCTTINSVLEKLLEQAATMLDNEVIPYDMVLDAVNVIEKNVLAHKYVPIKLYEHQKQLIQNVCGMRYLPRLISYTAPTGTGKTLTPLGLLSSKCVIFMCVARHIGLSLARAAIAAKAAVAFAFGCKKETDVRLHYAAAKRYTVDTKSGGIRKVDNTSGEKVRLIVCDIQSYRIAMNFMLKYQSASNLVWYWDEPTMTLDRSDHACHGLIRQNWEANQIPTVILCSATLPKSHELEPIHDAFKQRFVGAEVLEISSYDYRKSISLLNKAGFAETPHSVYKNADAIRTAARVCAANLTVLRYVDLGQVIRFMSHPVVRSVAKPTELFPTIDSITMESVKRKYLDLIMLMDNDQLEKCSQDLSLSQEPEYISTIYASSKDAYTISNGPAVFLCEDTKKVGQFMLQQARIPEGEISRIMTVIQRNEAICERVSLLEQRLNDCTAKDLEAGRAKKLGREERGGKGVQELTDRIRKLSSEIRSVELDSKYIPNRPLHLRKNKQDPETSDAFTSSLTEDDVTSILNMTNVPTSQKMLLMMGIGVFEPNLSPEYLAAIKELASEQKLYLIAASSDYTYGTNYQFAHGYLGADLCTTLTREKTIQALGRVGRGKCQQSYSIRVRDDSVIKLLLSDCKSCPERDNMVRLLGDDKKI